MTIAEIKKYTRDEKFKCMREGCEGHVTVVALSAGWYKECECGATWDHTDPKGRSVTKDEYERRAAELARRQNVAQTGRMSPGRDSIMASKKKAKKGKKSSAKKVAPAKKAAKSKSNGKTLERAYNGETYVVKVLDDGFEYKGKQFKSLTAVAKEITGYPSISGPKFFGLA